MSGANWTTQAQFDNSRRLATTEFVQRAIGNDASVVVVTANRAMTAADAGRYLFVNGSNLTFTLPNPASLPLGTKFRIAQGNLTTGGTIQAPGGVTIGNIQAGGTVTSVPIMQSTEYVLTVVSSTAYQITTIGGAHSLSPNGWQRLPSGMILQWGFIGCPANYAANTRFAFNLPIAFPSSALRIILSNAGANSVTPGTQAELISTSQAEVVWGQSSGTAAGLAATYVAFGF